MSWRISAAPLVDAPAARVKIGVGDVLNVSVFEAAAGGLFIPADAGSRPGNFVTLPPQQVDAAGSINVPFAGSVTVSGLTPQEVQRAIEHRLVERALEPQAVVTLADRRSGAVSVVGDVTTSTHFTLDPGGERVLSAVSRAAGPKFPSYETTVTIQRHGSSETALLSEIAVRPEQNVQLQPNDVVFVQHEPRYFLVFGATGNPTSLSTTNRRFAFGDTHLMLADALATAGGLEDDRSNPDAVFLLPSGCAANAGGDECRGDGPDAGHGADHLHDQFPRSGRLFHRATIPDACRRHNLREQRAGCGSCEIPVCPEHLHRLGQQRGQPALIGSRAVLLVGVDELHDQMRGEPGCCVGRTRPTARSTDA